MIAMARAFEPRRLAGGFAVLVLHLIVIAALLSATRWSEQQNEQTKEIILHLITPKPLPEPVKETLARKPVATPKPAPAFVPPATFAPPVDNSLPQLNGLNQQLFGCAPDQLASATAQQRAACASASLGPRFDPGATDYRDHTGRSKNRVQWARDRARKNAPLLLPCMSPAGIAPLYTAYCLAKSALTGKLDAESQPGYQDMPDHIVNEGDTRMAPVPH
jgi:hypothetical protein